MFRKTKLVAENQRVLVFKNQELNSVLTPGKHKIWDIKNELEFVTFDINQLFFCFGLIYFRGAYAFFKFSLRLKYSSLVPKS